MAQGQQMCSEELPSWQLPHPHWSPSGSELQGRRSVGVVGDLGGHGAMGQAPQRAGMQALQPRDLPHLLHPEARRVSGHSPAWLFSYQPGAGVNIVSAPIFQVKKQTLTRRVAVVMPVCAGSPVCPPASLIKTLVTALRACLVTLTVSFAM